MPQCERAGRQCADINAPDVNVSAPKTSGFNWWWLLLPLLIIGGLLLLAWLWRLLTGKARATT